MLADSEIHHNSEDVDARVLSDVLAALNRRVVISHEFDIPYIAGYSIDAKTVYIDRHLPLTLKAKNKDVRIEPFLVCHEIVEKASWTSYDCITFLRTRLPHASNEMP